VCVRYVAVCLCVQYQGIFHFVKKVDSHYTLRYPKPPFYAFWREDSRPFQARADDPIYYFVRVFAPTRFKHKVMIRWEKYDRNKNEFATSDHLPLPVVGGRNQGFRGFVMKSRVTPCRWRVTAETQDGRVIGRISFRVKKDTSTKERRWKQLKM